jgi:hypothetical protein
MNNNFLFRLLDRIPYIRRSGNATVIDLAKALVITLVLVLAIEIPLYGMSGASILAVLLFCVPIMAFILFLHPFLSHRKSLRETMTGTQTRNPNDRR